MKTRDLATGIFYFLAGVACLLTALLTESSWDGILFGFSGAGICPGILMICKYFYWSSPKNKARYQEKLENEKIELQDELKEKLRNQAGRQAYILGLLVICVSILIFSLPGVIASTASSRMIVLYLGGYLLFQIVAVNVIFNRLAKRYGI